MSMVGGSMLVIINFMNKPVIAGFNTHQARNTPAISYHAVGMIAW